MSGPCVSGASRPTSSCRRGRFRRSASWPRQAALELRDRLLEQDLADVATWLALRLPGAEVLLLAQSHYSQPALVAEIAYVVVETKPQAVRRSCARRPRGRSRPLTGTSRRAMPALPRHQRVPGGGWTMGAVGRGGAGLSALRSLVRHARVGPARIYLPCLRAPRCRFPVHRRRRALRLAARAAGCSRARRSPTHRRHV